MEELQRTSREAEASLDLRVRTALETIELRPSDFQEESLDSVTLDEDVDPDADSDPKRSKRSAKEKAVDLSRPVPTQGWPKRWYGIKLFLLKKSDRVASVPEMNHAEAQQYRIAQMIRRILVASETMQRIVAVVNSKGGAGKTPLTALLALLLQAILGDVVLGVDANENAGNLNSWYGVDTYDTLRLPDAVKDRNALELQYFASVARLTKGHPVYRGRLISSDTSSDDPYRFTVDEYIAFLETVKHGFHSVMLDCGNGHEYPSNIGSVEKANVIIFSTMADRADSFEGLIKTMLQFINAGHESKVHNGLIVVSGVRKGQTKKHFLKRIAHEAGKLRRRTETSDGVVSYAPVTLQDLQITADRLLLVPYSEYLSVLKPVSLRPQDIGLDTFEGLLAVLDAMFATETVYPPSKNRRAHAIPPESYAPRTPQGE